MLSLDKLATLSILICLPVTACSSDDSGGGGGGPVGPAAEGPITSLPAGWNEVDPGGATSCSDGSPFKFWVRPGRVNRVVVEFRGGGACWDKVTCYSGDSLFNPKAEPEPWMSDASQAVGIYDHTRSDNPFKDWHHVYVSYCTGDVHWGDAHQVYDPGGPLETTIEHKGAVNAKAALDWVYENVPTPDKVFVTGCSAGGYGAALWSPYVKQHYTSSETYLFADSAAGIITDTFFQQSFPAWNAAENFPNFIGVDPSTFTKLPELYIGIGKTFPDMFISQYNSYYDDTQHTYYAAMGGGDAAEWSQKMRDNLTEIENGAASFRYYLAPNYTHCVINKDDFYTMSVNGMKVVDWLKNAVVEDKTPDSVNCGNDCGAPKPAQ